MICSTGKVKFIHIRIPKCASTSISNYLMDYCDDKFKNMYKSDKNGQMVFPHLRYHQYVRLLEKYDLDINDYYVFSFVRNPYNLVVSRWKSKNVKFGKWLKIKDRKLKVTTNSVFEQQVNFLTVDGTVYSDIKVDYCPKYRMFSKGLEVIGAKINVDFSKLPRMNKSIFLNTREAVYDAACTEIVNRRFADDFRRLGYDTR